MGQHLKFSTQLRRCNSRRNLSLNNISVGVIVCDKQISPLRRTFKEQILYSGADLYL